MTNINLLPWREQLKKEKQKEFVIFIVLIIGISLFLCLMIHLVLAAQYARQNAVNNYLTSEINQVDQQIIEVTALKQKRSDLLHRLRIIQELQTNRVELVQMFYSFVQILPPGIYITKVQKNGNTITVEGRAQSNQQVSNFMKNVAISKSFKDPILTEIQDNDDPKQSTAMNSLYTLGFEVRLQPRFSVEENTEDATTAAPQAAAPAQGPTS